MSDESRTEATDADDGAASGASLLRDVFEPAAKEMGRALETMTRAFNLALAPISVLAWGYDAMRDTMVAPMANRMRKGLDAVGNLIEEIDTGTFAGAAGKMIEAVSPALLTRKSSSADLVYDPELETLELGCDEACLTIAATKAKPKARQFDFAVSRTGTYVLQTKGRHDLVLGLFNSEPPYRRITYKDDGGEGRNPLIRREFQPGVYFLVVKRFGGEPFERDFELCLAPEPEPKESKK